MIFLRCKYQKFNSAELGVAYIIEGLLHLALQARCSGFERRYCGQSNKDSYQVLKFHTE